jgi:FtsZ-binding cell division protein ZapB
MSDLVEIVDALENKISKLLHKIDLLGQTNSKLKEELGSLRKAHSSTEVSVSEWEEKFNSLKLANSMVGSENDKTEAKLKINSLIRDIDHCIAQLAE